DPARRHPQAEDGAERVVMSDEEDIESVSRRLAGTDFSADSRIRASLRAALLKRQREGHAAPRSFPARVAPLALVLAAAALVLLLPFRAKRPRPDTARVAPPAAPAPARAVPLRAPAPHKPAFPRDELGLPILPGRLASNGPSGEAPPIATRPLDRLIEIHRGRVILKKDGRAVIWETGGADYILETRRISLGDIFETRTL
ncbi:MAG: hypothetical protein NUW21_09730, partial [Elusimicrobia bacterium]|nr:hypothetical protein [Elusimicrobiota bacterium]